MSKGGDTPPSQGLAVRQDVLGKEHVERASAEATSFDRDFQAYLTDHVWGAVWARPGLGRRERSLITVALLAALGHDRELALHVRAARQHGLSEAEIAEALMHTGVYAGVPAANHAMGIAKEVLAEGKSKKGEEQ